MSGTFNPLGSFATTIWRPAKNNSGSIQVPAFGLVSMSGYSTRDERTILVAERPGITGFVYAANGPQPMDGSLAEGGNPYGMVTFDWPAWVKYDPGDGAPVAGEIWGPKNGQYTLSKSEHGFMIIGSPDTDNEIVLVSPIEVGPSLQFGSSFHASTASDIAGGTAGSPAAIDIGFDGAYGVSQAQAPDWNATYDAVELHANGWYRFNWHVYGSGADADGTANIQLMLSTNGGSSFSSLGDTTHSLPVSNGGYTASGGCAIRQLDDGDLVRVAGYPNGISPTNLFVTGMLEVQYMANDRHI